MESLRSRTLEEAKEVKHFKQILLERALRGDAAGSYRSRAIEEATEVEHLKKLLLEDSCGGMQQEAMEVHLRKL